jgi:hypothetical protein
MQLDGAAHLMSEPVSGHSNGSRDDEDDDASELVEIHLIPADESTCTPSATLLTIVPAFYEALCSCATLHPDPSAAEDDIFDENHQWITADNFTDATDVDEATDGNVSKWRRTE